MRPAAGGQGAGAALLYPGISLAYMVGGQAHIHQIEGDRLRITYCRAGQLVWEQDGGQRHLAPGDFAVQGGAAPGETTPETRPSGDFAGLALSVDLQEAAACPPEPLGDAAVFGRLRNRFCGGNQLVVLTENGESRNLFSAFYDKPGDLQLPYRRIKALELLLYLAGWEPAKDQPQEYRAEQVAVVRAIHGHLLAHMEERVTIEELSRRYLMNPTTLKAAFKAVYGTSLGAHIKEHRMEQAARMLRESGRSIAGIAQAVGYDSQSRFAAAFKEVFGVLPSVYRRQGKE